MGGIIERRSRCFRERRPSFLSQVLDNVSDGVYFVDTERMITYWNKGSEAISGFDSASVVGRHCYENILRPRR